MTTPQLLQQGAPERALAIAKSMEEQIARVTKDALAFWTTRNVRELSKTYQLLANRLGEAGFESLHVMKAYLNTLEEIEGNAAAHEKTGKPSRLKLLTAKDLSSFEKSEAVKRVHTVAIEQFRTRSLDHTGMQAAEFSSFYFSSDAAVREAINTEKNLALGQFDLAATHAYNQEELKVSTILTTLLTHTTDGVNVNKDIVKELTRSYEKQLAIIQKVGATGVGCYRMWTFHLNQLRQQICTEIDALGAEGTEGDYAATLKVLEKEQLRVHSLAHREYLSYLEKFEFVDRLCASNADVLFKSSLTLEMIAVYNRESNTFQEISKEAATDEQVLDTLQEMQKLAYLLSHNHFVAVEKFTLETRNLAQTLESLIAKMKQIETTHFTAIFKRSKNPNVSQKAQNELEKLLTFHLMGAIQHATESSKATGNIAMLEEYFGPQSIPTFYLHLANDLKLLSSVVEIKWNDTFCKLIVSTLQREQPLQVKAATDEQMEAAKLVLRVNTLRRGAARKSGGSRGDSAAATMLASTLLEDVNRTLVKHCEPAIRILGTLDEVPDPTSEDYSAQVKTLTAEVYQSFPEVLFYFQLIDKESGFQYTFELPNGEVIEFNQPTVALLHAMVGEYLLNIQPYEEAQKSKVELKALMAIPASTDLEVTTVEEVQAEQLVKLQDKLGETLIMGLRFYHTQLALLTTFLDWPTDALKEMFLDHILKQRMVRKKKLKKFPTQTKFATYKAGLSKGNLVYENRVADQKAREFKSALIPYRNVQTAAYQFYGALGNVLIGDPYYLDLPDLIPSDFDLLIQRIEDVDPVHGVFGQGEAEAAVAIKPYLAEIRSIIAYTPTTEVTQKLTEFFETPRDGVVLATKKVSVLNLKLIIKVLKLTNAKREIKSLNLNAMNKLFSTDESRDFGRYTAQTIRFVTEPSIENLKAFLGEFKLDAVNPFASYCPDAKGSNLLEYYKAAQPFMLLGESPNTYFLKWPAFVPDIIKRFAKGELDPTRQAILKASSALNEAKRSVEVSRA